MDNMEAIKQTFFEECDEQLADLESGLLAIEDGSGDQETVNAVFRAVHSIKGGAGAFRLEKLVHFAHTFETTLDLVREDKLEPTADVLRVMLRSADILTDLVAAARGDTDVDDALWQPNAEELVALTKMDGAVDAPQDAAPTQEVNGEDEFGFQPVMISVGGPADTADNEDGAAAYDIRFKPRPELYESANDPCILLRELCALGEATVACDVRAIPMLDEIDPDGAYLVWNISLKTEAEQSELSDIFDFVEDDCELEITRQKAEDVDDNDWFVPTQISIGSPVADEPAPVGDPVNAGPADATATAAKPEPAPATAAAVSAPAPVQTIRVELDRVDRLINLVGELVINQAMLSQSISKAGLEASSDAATGVDELEQLTRQLQEGVMAIRAQPVKSLFQRMSRTVREAADATGKVVRLQTEGEMTEVDKTVVERLADPLTHMIRNAVDHGLEGSEKREASDKPREGIVRLSAAHRSGRVVIEVSDDGAGINRERVRDIAIEKGVITSETVLTDNEVDNLIFAPGFSTASEVSDLSGRGVGMDVVKRSIHALGGRISIASEPGSGSIFTLSLPLTLAVLDGMLVSVGEQTLVVPITSIVETLRPDQSSIHQIGANGWVLSVRDEFVPLIDTDFELGFRQRRDMTGEGVVLLVETDTEQRCALLVDAIQDQSQVVIKSLETNYGQVEGVSAATILGDGRVALILDIDALVGSYRTGSPSIEPPLAMAG
ncbi:MAG: chemotaxis protein CheA [Hyphomicrobiaceae bacterium]